MAEIVLSPLIQEVIGALRSLLTEEIKVLWGVEDDLRSLSSTLSTIQSVVADAEEKQVQSDTIKDWLRKLKDVAYDAEDVADDFSLKALHKKPGSDSQFNTRKKVPTLCFCFTLLKDIAFRHKIGDNIRKLRKRLDEIAKERFQFHFLEMNVPSSSQSTRYSTPLIDASIVIGREEEKDELQKELLTSNESSTKLPSIIAIVGMGGLGKTTLARLVYNSKDTQDYFHVRGWVHVSDRFEERRVTREIVESISGKECSSVLQPEIQLRKLIEGKRSLIVLDDVWDDIISHWDNFRVPFTYGGEGSKIIITTRSEKVLQVMGISSSYHLKGLSDNECLELFTGKVFVNGDEEKFPNLIKIGKKLAKKCGGVPLAVNTLSGLLMNTRDEDLWKGVLMSSFWNLPQNENSILPALKLSYHHLPSKVKPCFTFCSLFPKGFEFDKDELIRMWMAQGYIQKDEWREEEDEGDEYFNELLMRSFFSPRYFWDRYMEMYVMHDLVHDLAESLAKEECVRLHYAKDLIHRMDSFRSRARHASLNFSEQVEKVSLGELSRYKSLHTLIVQNESSFLGRNLPFLKHEQKFIAEMKFLRLLCLKQSSINQIMPDVICSLGLLRYLDLSSTEIEELPDSICGLTYLQTLDVHSCTKLKKLSDNTATHLTSLRCLDTYGCESLNSMPPHIGKLTKLRVMSRFVAGEEEGVRLAELKGLNRLKGRLQIGGLENVGNGEEAKEADLKKKQLTSLDLNWTRTTDENDDRSSIDEEVLANLQPHIDLKELSLSGYKGSELPSWLCHLPSLQSLELRDCPKLATLPRHMDHLKSLHRLDLRNCPKLAWLPRDLEIRRPDFKKLRRRDLKIRRPRTRLPTSLPYFTIDGLMYFLYKGRIGLMETSPVFY